MLCEFLLRCRHGRNWDVREEVSVLASRMNPRTARAKGTWFQGKFGVVSEWPQ